VLNYLKLEGPAEKTKLMRISREPSPVQIVIDERQLENVEYLSYLGSMITNDARCTDKLNPGFPL
jgi:hypothetical protein